MKRLWMLFGMTALFVSAFAIGMPGSSSAQGASGCGQVGANDLCYVLVVQLTGNVPDGVTVTATREQALSGYNDNTITLYGPNDNTPCGFPATTWTCSDHSPSNTFTTYNGIDQLYGSGSSGPCMNPGGPAPGGGTLAASGRFHVVVSQNGQQIGSSEVNACGGGNQNGAWVTQTSIAVDAQQTATKGGIKGTSNFLNSDNNTNGACNTTSFVQISGGPDKLANDKIVKVNVNADGTWTTDQTLTPGGGYSVAITCYDGTSTQPYTASQDNITVPQGGFASIDFKDVKPVNVDHGGNTTCQDGTLAQADGSCPNNTTAVVDCGAEGFNWIVCPFVKLALKAANLMDSFIMDQLDIDVTTIFDNTATTGTTQSGYYTAWSQFRIIATSLLVIGGLVMVVSTALGFEFLDAYTIRKTLPRLLIAIIGISLSWPLMRLCVDFFDTIGFGIRSIMYAPFQHMGGTIGVGTGILTSAVVVGGLFITPAGWTLVITALLAAFVGFLILIIRQAALIMLVILAPVAIAAYVLPNTQKVWKLWSDNFFGLLLMFPIISGLIAAGHIFAAVTINANPGNSPKAIIAQAIALIAYFMVYFLLPMAARLATGLIGNLAGFVNDRHKGAFDRLKGAREKSRQQTHQRRMAGQTKFGSSWAGKNLYRRAALVSTPNSGALSLTSKGRANFNAANTTALQHATAEILKNDNGRAAGDDAAMKAAMSAKNANEFISRYKDATREMNGKAATDAEARAALALTQSSFGTNMGSAAMQSAAFAARAASVTGYSESDAGKKELFENAGEMVRKGYMTSSDAMAAIKQNKARLDQSGISFGTGLGAINKAATRPGSIDQSDINGLMNTVMDGMTPGSLIGARKESAQMLVRHYTRRLNETIASSGGIDTRETKKVMGDIAGIQDTINSQAPQMSKVFADGLMGTQLAGTNMSIRDYNDELRRTQDVDWNDGRKEWLTNGTPPGGQLPGQQPQNPAGGAPGQP